METAPSSRGVSRGVRSLARSAQVDSAGTSCAGGTGDRRAPRPRAPRRGAVPAGASDGRCRRRARLHPRRTAAARPGPSPRPCPRGGEGTRRGRPRARRRNARAGSRRAPRPARAANGACGSSGSRRRTRDDHRAHSQAGVFGEDGEPRGAPVGRPGVEQLGESRCLPPGGEDAQGCLGPARGQLQRTGPVGGDLQVIAFTAQPISDGLTEPADGEHVHLGHWLPIHVNGPARRIVRRRVGDAD